MAGFQVPGDTVAFSPDGKSLAAGCKDQTIRLWDATTRELLPAFPRFRSWVSSVAFAPDGRTFVAGTADSCVTVWDLKTGKQAVALEQHTGSFAGQGQLRGNTLSVAYSPDGRFVAGGDNEGLVMVWDVATGHVSRVFWTRDSTFAYSMAFSADSRTLAVAYDNGPVRLWDLEKEEEIRAFALPPDTYSFISVAFSPDGKMLAIGNGKERESGEVLIWDLTRSGAPKTLRGHTWPVLSVAFSADGRLLVSGGQDMTVRLWDTASRRELARLTGHTHTIASVAFSPDGRTLASCGYDGTVRLWDVSGRTGGAKLARDP